MNMDEARAARIALEAAIRGAVSEFHRATGAKVDKIALTRYEVKDCMNKVVVATEYEVSVSAE